MEGGGGVAEKEGRAAATMDSIADAPPSTSTATAAAEAAEAAATAPYRALLSSLQSRRRSREASLTPDQLKKLNLDSTVKRASAAVKRLREWGSGSDATEATSSAGAAAEQGEQQQPQLLSASDAAALLAAIDAVNLSKYCGEAASAIAESASLRCRGGKSGGGGREAAALATAAASLSARYGDEFREALAEAMSSAVDSAVAALKSVDGTSPVPPSPSQRRQREREALLQRLRRLAGLCSDLVLSGSLPSAPPPSRSSAVPAGIRPLLSATEALSGVVARACVSRDFALAASAASALASAFKRAPAELLLGSPPRLPEPPAGLRETEGEARAVAGVLAELEEERARAWVAPASVAAALKSPVASALGSLVGRGALSDASKLAEDAERGATAGVMLLPGEAVPSVPERAAAEALAKAAAALAEVAGGKGGAASKAVQAQWPSQKIRPPPLSLDDDEGGADEEKEAAVDPFDAAFYRRRLPDLKSLVAPSPSASPSRSRASSPTRKGAGVASSASKNSNAKGSERSSKQRQQQSAKPASLDAAFAAARRSANVEASTRRAADDAANNLFSVESCEEADAAASAIVLGATTAAAAAAAAAAVSSSTVSLPSSSAAPASALQLLKARGKKIAERAPLQVGFARAASIPFAARALAALCSVCPGLSKSLAASVEAAATVPPPSRHSSAPAQQQDPHHAALVAEAAAAPAAGETTPTAELALDLRPQARAAAAALLAELVKFGVAPPEAALRVLARAVPAFGSNRSLSTITAGGEVAAALFAGLGPFFLSLARAPTPTTPTSTTKAGEVDDLRLRRVNRERIRFLGRAAADSLSNRRHRSHSNPATAPAEMSLEGALAVGLGVRVDYGDAASSSAPAFDDDSDEDDSTPVEALFAAHVVRKGLGSDRRSAGRVAARLADVFSSVGGSDGAVGVGVEAAVARELLRSAVETAGKAKAAARVAAILGSKNGGKKVVPGSTGRDRGRRRRNGAAVAPAACPSLPALLTDAALEALRDRCSLPDSAPQATLATARFVAELFTAGCAPPSALLSALEVANPPPTPTAESDGGGGEAKKQSLAAFSLSDPPSSFVRARSAAALIHAASTRRSIDPAGDEGGGGGGEQKEKKDDAAKKKREKVYSPLFNFGLRSGDNPFRRPRSAASKALALHVARLWLSVRNKEETFLSQQQAKQQQRRQMPLDVALDLGEATEAWRPGFVPPRDSAEAEKAVASAVAFLEGREVEEEEEEVEEEEEEEEEVSSSDSESDSGSSSMSSSESGSGSGSESESGDESASAPSSDDDDDEDGKRETSSVAAAAAATATSPSPTAAELALEAELAALGMGSEGGGEKQQRSPSAPPSTAAAATATAAAKPPVAMARFSVLTRSRLPSTASEAPSAVAPSSEAPSAPAERRTILLPASAAPAAARAREAARDEAERVEIARLTLRRAMELDDE